MRIENSKKFRAQNMHYGLRVASYGDFFWIFVNKNQIRASIYVKENICINKITGERTMLWTHRI